MPVILPVKNISPSFGNDCFIAPNATIVGDVEMGDKCSVWFNAVIRGDVHYIKIGNNTNIQDGACIHCTYMYAPTNIGNIVSIGHNALVHGCTLKDNVLIGMGAIVMDDAVVESNSVIAAGAVVLPGTHVEAGSVYGGTPAKRINTTSEELKATIQRTAKNYPMYAEWFKGV